MIRPVGHNVLIKTFKDEVKYKNILFVPDTAMKRSCEGVVLKVGERCFQVNQGDWVIFSRKQAHDVDEYFVGGQHVIVDERGVMVVIEEEVKDIAY